jgi:acyl carrier protein
MFAALGELIREFSTEEMAGGIPASANLADVGIDSLGLVDLLFRIETEFGVEIPDERIPLIVSVQDLVDHVTAAAQ